ncbi:MAG: CDGSH iron-sulfur domain-containing protein [Thioalkalispiraceae bacterium]|jgi:CDGSH-type Zn-finger protein
MNNIFLVRANGPLIARGKISVQTADGDVLLEDAEAFLCRCGDSKRKPFCDGSHKVCGFSDPGDFIDVKAELPEAEGGLLITLRDNAMLIAKGPMIIQSEDGKSKTTRNKAAFCRCGESNNKPFCDASHKRCGFKSSD